MRLAVSLMIMLLLCIQPVMAAEQTETPDDPGTEPPVTQKAEKVYWDSSYTHKTLVPGEKFDLRPAHSPSTAEVSFVYRSKNRRVARVTEKGSVKALKKGNTTVTVRDRLSGKSAEYYIHVGEKVKKVRWKNTGSTRTIYMGKTFDFNAKCKPSSAAYRKIKYRSSNKNVVKVTSKGVITPVKNGTATITADAADQSGKKASCKVTVKTRVTRVKLSASYQTCFTGETMKISSTVSPETASDKTLKWTSSDKSIATVTQKGTVKGIRPGTVQITAAAKDGSNRKGKYTVYVNNLPDPSKVWYIAHRGYSSEYPENTVQAFTAAAGLPYKGIEVDIWENDRFYSEREIRENGKTNPEFVVMHDNTLTRMCGSDLNVTELTSGTIGSYPVTKGNGNDPSVRYTIPLLDDFVGILKNSDKVLVIELKDKELSEAAADKLINYLDEQGVSGRTNIISFEKQSLLNVRKVLGEREDIKLTRLLGSKDRKILDQEIEWSVSENMDEVSINHRYITAAYIEMIKKSGLQAGAWVVDEKHRAADLIRMGCDHITTNVILWE